MNHISKIDIIKYISGNFYKTIDEVLSTCSVEITINDEVKAKYCTIEKDLDLLALGYSHCNNLTIQELLIKKLDASIVKIIMKCNYREDKYYGEEKNKLFSITCSEILHLIDLLNNFEFFKRTDATHTALTYNLEEKRVISTYEDYSRLCTIYKIVGLSLRKSINLKKCFLIISCRIDSYIMRMIINAGFSGIATISAITLNALKLAKKFNITLVGFARPSEKRLNIYHIGNVVIT